MYSRFDPETVIPKAAAHLKALVPRISTSADDALIGKVVVFTLCSISAFLDSDESDAVAVTSSWVKSDCISICASILATALTVSHTTFFFMPSLFCFFFKRLCRSVRGYEFRKALSISQS